MWSVIHVPYVVFMSWVCVDRLSYSLEGMKSHYENVQSSRKYTIVLKLRRRYKKIKKSLSYLEHLYRPALMTSCILVCSVHLLNELGKLKSQEFF